jgi:hypothetical protein
MTHWKSEDRRLLGMLLSPSWLSGFVVVLVGLGITVGTIVTFSFDTSVVQQQLLSWQQHQPSHALTTPDQIVADPKPTLRDTWPLLLVWSAVGLLVYALAINVIQALSNAEKLRVTMDYVNASPKAMMHSAIEHFILRFLAGLSTVGLLWLFFHHTVPYSITAAHASAVEPVSLAGVVYALLSFGIVVFNLHLVVIFARLTVGRVRIFSN